MHRIVLSVLAIVFVMLWSSGWTASQYAATTSGVLNVLSARYVIVVALLIVIVTLFRQWQRMPLHEVMLHLLIGALCHALYLLGSVSALELGVSAATIAFINALQPMSTACLAGVITGEKIKARQLKGLFLGIVSVALIVSESYYALRISSLALALPFIAILALSTGLTLNRRQEIKASNSNRNARPVFLLLLVHCIGAALIILPLAAVKGDLQWHFTSTQWGAVLWLAIVVTVGSYGLLLLLLKHISAVGASSLTYLVPPATMVQSYILFGETLSCYSAFALCIAGGAVYLIFSSPSTESRQTRTGTGSAVIANLRLRKLSAHPAGIDIRL